VHGFVGGQLLNYWDFAVFVIRRPDAFDDRATRGGPVVGKPGMWFLVPRLNTDERKPLSIRLNPQLWWNDEGATSYGINLNLAVRPASNLSLSFAPHTPARCRPSNTSRP